MQTQLLEIAAVSLRRDYHYHCDYAYQGLDLISLPRGPMCAMQERKARNAFKCIREKNISMKIIFSSFYDNDILKYIYEIYLTLSFKSLSFNILFKYIIR